MSLSFTEIQIGELMKSFLKEDIGTGDVTTDSIVSANLHGEGHFLAKEACVLAGLDLAREAFSLLDSRMKWKAAYAEGDTVAPDRIIAQVRGKARALLTGERVALNILQRLSGIATETSRYVQAVKEACRRDRVTKIPFVLDTRKTTPGWRELEKYAVRCGGGMNHRLGLYDAILIKDNHIVIAGGVKEAIKQVTGAIRQRDGGSSRCQVSGARGQVSGAQHNGALRIVGSRNGVVHSDERRGYRWRRRLPIEVEVTNFEQLREALAMSVDRILLDNMSPLEVRDCVKIARGSPGGKRMIIECSGGISLKSIRKYATTGVDWISVGALTHSAKAVDISFEVIQLSAVSHQPSADSRQP